VKPVAPWRSRWARRSTPTAGRVRSGRLGDLVDKLPTRSTMNGHVRRRLSRSASTSRAHEAVAEERPDCVPKLVFPGRSD
jgi:hypothetical protein